MHRARAVFDLSQLPGAGMLFMMPAPVRHATPRLRGGIVSLQCQPIDLAGLVHEGVRRIVQAWQWSRDGGQGGAWCRVKWLKRELCCLQCRAFR
jgi:hypothetical protein